MNEKLCRRCKTIKDVSNFHKQARSPDGYYCWCKVCRKEYDKSKADIRLAYHRNRYHTKKDMYYNSLYKRTYGINLEDYNKMLQEQNNVCYIYKQACGSGRKLAVDHDHATLKVRGLLCLECNRGLSAFKDNVDLLATAITYLQRS